VFIKQASFTKLLKDAQIQEDKMNLLGQKQSWKTVTEKEVNLLLSKEPEHASQTGPPPSVQEGKTGQPQGRPGVIAPPAYSAPVGKH